MSSLSFYDDFDQTAKKGEDTTSGLFSPFTFLIITLILSLFGLMMLYSATFDYAVENNRPHYYYLMTQFSGLVIGLLIGLALRLLPLSFIRKTHYFFSLLTVTAFIIYFIKDRGQSGYITASGMKLLSVPSLAVFSSVLSFSSTMPEIEKSDRFGVLYLISISYHIAIALLCAASGGLGAYAVYVLTIIIMMKPAGISRGYIVLASIFSAVLFAIILFTSNTAFSFFASAIMPVSDSSFFDGNMLSSLTAIKEGGIFGVKIGHGIFKMMKIDGTECRFIFTTMAEELGFFGINFILLLVLLYHVVAIRTERRALKEENTFIASSSIGLSAMVIIPFLLSIMHTLAIFPFSGTSIPFFAYCPGNEALYIAGSYLLYKEIFIIGRRKNDKIK